MFFQTKFFRIAQTPHPLFYLKWDSSVKRIVIRFSILKWPEHPKRFRLKKHCKIVIRSLTCIWSDNCVLCFSFLSRFLLSSPCSPKADTDLLNWLLNSWSSDSILCFWTSHCSRLISSPERRQMCLLGGFCLRGQPWVWMANSCLILHPPCPLTYCAWTIVCLWSLMGMVPLGHPWLTCAPQISYCGSEYSLFTHY